MGNHSESEEDDDSDAIMVFFSTFRGALVLVRTLRYRPNILRAICGFKGIQVLPVTREMPCIAGNRGNRRGLRSHKGVGLPPTGSTMWEESVQCHAKALSSESIPK